MKKKRLKEVNKEIWLKRVNEKLSKSKKFVQGLNIYMKRKNMRIRLRIGDILTKIFREILLD